MIRLSTPQGENLETAPDFDVHVAGAEANVAAALARLGRKVQWFSRVPDNALGRRVLSELARAGVDTSAVDFVANARMGIYFVELQTPPRRTSVIYDRGDSAVWSITPEDIPWDLVEGAAIVHLTGITPALSASCRSTCMELAKATAAAGAKLSFDVNYRAKLWSPKEAAAALEPIMDLADLLMCTREDASELFGITGPAAEVAAHTAERHSTPHVVITDGPGGAWWWDQGKGGHVEADDVVVIDRLGAGDAFTAGVLDGVLDGDLTVGVHRGAVLATVALTTKGDQVVVTRAEMEEAIRGSGRSVDR
jgi:2-dehydro-3-deoxygluconokinase